MNYNDFNTGAREMLNELPDWHVASVSDKFGHSVQKALGEETCQLISFITICKCAIQTSACLIWAIIAAIFLISAALCILIGGTGTTLEIGIILLVIYFLFASLANKTTALYKGAKNFDSHFGLKNTDIKLSTRHRVIIYLSMLILLPYSCIATMLSFLGFMVATMFNASATGENFFTKMVATNKIMLPSGVLSTFDELIDDENYLSFKNIVNRTLDGLGEFAESERKNYQDDLRKSIQDNKYKLSNVYYDIDSPEYKATKAQYEKERETYKREFGDDGTVE